MIVSLNALFWSIGLGWNDRLIAGSYVRVYGAIYKNFEFKLPRILRRFRQIACIVYRDPVIRFKIRLFVYSSTELV
jgi:hypothetical protein